jgi:hypothetical protein
VSAWHDVAVLVPPGQEIARERMPHLATVTLHCPEPGHANLVTHEAIEREVAAHRFAN